MDIIENYGAMTNWMYLALVAGFCEEGSIEFRNFLINLTNVSLPVYWGQTHARMAKKGHCFN
jgi:hypothetical protein